MKRLARPMASYTNWLLVGLACYTQEAFSATSAASNQALSPQFDAASSEEVDDQAVASSAEMQQELQSLDSDDGNGAATEDAQQQQPQPEPSEQSEQPQSDDGVDAAQQQLGDLGFNGLIVAQPPRNVEASKGQIAVQQDQSQQVSATPQLRRRQEVPKSGELRGANPRRPPHSAVLKQPAPLLQVSSRQALQNNTIAAAPAASPAGAVAGPCGVGDAVQVRPKEGCGLDTVNFGLYAKTFYGVNEKTYTFMVDLIMTLRWSDPRVASLIPSGQQSLTLSAKDAAKMVWLPEVAVTNRAIRQSEIISTSIAINTLGEVEKVERILVRAHCKYNLEMYPWDEQKLAIMIASTKYMLDEVVLAPIRDDGVTGMANSFLSGVPYSAIYVETDVFEDIDGSLQKSRGRLIIKVKRIFSKYSDDFLTPALLTTAISWGVFYFPYVQAFVTPRLALSILALLTFVNQSQKIDGQMPDGVPQTWHSTFVGSVQVLMFMGIMLNIAVESVEYQFKLPALSKKMNHEAKILIPVLGIGTWSICFALSDLFFIKVISLGWIWGVVGLYAYFRGVALVRAQKEKTAHEQHQEKLHTLEAAVKKADDVVKEFDKALKPFHPLQMSTKDPDK